MIKRIFPIYFFVLVSLLMFNSCVKKKSNSKFGLIIHGGAGNIYKGRYSSEEEKAYKDKLTESLKSGYEILESGGSSLDAVEKVINILEDSPLFNAGRGAVFASSGENELDASIMEGKTLNAGAVTGVKHIKNPISLARSVMVNSPHVLLSGDGAESFAVQSGFELVDKKYFFTQKRWNDFQSTVRKKDAEIKIRKSTNRNEKEHGTVGCAALDKYGNLAAGTSTGGMTNKMFGRIGDSPIIGAGTYANNKTCAISATGYGEYFMRGVICYDISAMMQYKGISLKEAADEVIQKKLNAMGGTGGVIAIDNDGSIAVSFNSEGMFRGYLLSGDVIHIEMYSDKK